MVALNYQTDGTAMQINKVGSYLTSITHAPTLSLILKAFHYLPSP